MISCYVGGRGMGARQATWNFKTTVFETLVYSGLGYDTRYRYYRSRFGELDDKEFARMVCDPIEYYDPDWPSYRVRQQEAGVSEDMALTAFVMERDTRFRQDAEVGIYCYDEAAMGSGINSMRLLGAGKPIIGFCHKALAAPDFNLQNVLQLALEFPTLFTLIRYSDVDSVGSALLGWLSAR